MILYLIKCYSVYEGEDSMIKIAVFLTDGEESIYIYEAAMLPRLGDILIFDYPPDSSDPGGSNKYSVVSVMHCIGKENPQDKEMFVYSYDVFVAPIS